VELRWEPAKCKKKKLEERMTETCGEGKWGNRGQGFAKARIRKTTSARKVKKKKKENSRESNCGSDGRGPGRINVGYKQYMEVYERKGSKRARWGEVF